MKQIALITGGSSGIGLATASELAEQYSLILLARKSKGLAIAKRFLEERGAKVEVIARDVNSDSDSLERKIRRASLTLGGNGTIQVLIHSAGVTIEENTTLEEEKSCYYTNAFGTENILLVCENIIAPGGFVLVLSSLSAFADLPGISKVYGWSKRDAAKIAWDWREDYGKVGATISVAFPPVVDTPMVQKLKRTAPIYRAFPWLSAEEVARVSVGGMFARKASIHFSRLYSTLAKVAMLAPRTVSLVMRFYIPFVVYIKGRA